MSTDNFDVIISILDLKDAEAAANAAAIVETVSVNLMSTPWKWYNSKLYPEHLL